MKFCLLGIMERRSLTSQTFVKRRFNNVVSKLLRTIASIMIEFGGHFYD